MTHEPEFQRRSEAVVRAIREKGVRRAVFSSRESIYYLTGASYEPLERPFFLSVDADSGRYRMLVPLLESNHLLGKSWGVPKESIDTYREFPAPAGEGWSDRLGDTLNVPFVFEPSTPHHVAAFLLEAGGRPAELLSPIRAVKSPWEIERIRRAAAFADWGVARILKASYFGSTVAESGLAVRGFQVKVVREVPAFDWAATEFVGAAWPAPLSAEPHSIPPVGLRLLKGPHVALVLSRINGYAAECERTFFTSPPSAQARDRYALMLEARRRAISMVRPGQPCAEIDAAVNELLLPKGWGPPQRLHRIGHGFGLCNHEAPYLAEGSTDVLAENMVISIEPGLYDADDGGYRHSDTILVTRDGSIPLTRAPDQIDQLTLGRASLAQRVKGYAVRRVLRLG